MGKVPLLPSLVPYAPRCESLVDPVGVGRARPSLSWKLRAARPGARGLRQSAYEVRVGSRPGGRDLWDSGRVRSDAQFGVEYAGKPLRSGGAAFWSVRAWDAAGVPSAWSAPARFSLGLLDEKDWKAKWIAYDAPDAPDPLARRFEGASWIWSAEDPGPDVPAVKRTFERTFSLDAAPKTARLEITADDRYEVRINGETVRRTEFSTDAWRTPAKLDVARFLKKGDNAVSVEAENAATGPAGLLARLTVGSRTVVTDAAWTEGGKPARVVAPYGKGPWGRFAEGRTMRPSVVYGRTFRVHPGLVRATAHVTALGLVDLYLDGRRVAEDRFTPGWTDYKKRVYARSYDVTAKLKRGDHSIGAEVGDGWYSGYVGYAGGRAHYGERPRLRAQLELLYADGTKDTVATDEGWSAAAGATRVQDFLIGEEFDARPRKVEWKRPTVVTDVKAKVEPFPGVPVLPYARLKAVKATRQGDGYVLDFGQNMAGFAHLKAKGRKGQTVRLRFVEALNPDGTPYTANLRTARATDAYTFAGTGVEEWEPRFTFHGFRYVKVTGLGHAPAPDEITAVAISSATPETGTFRCSDPLLNKLARNAWWTQKMNFIDVPTDCPQRDERLGWMGDAQAYVRTAATYSDVQAFFAKWLVTVDDDQGADGNFPKFAPAIMDGADGGPAWAEAGVICPWTVYDVYGDKRLLAEHYPAMRRFVEFTRARSKPDLTPPDRYHCFGDWLNVNADTPNDVIYMAYFAYSADLLARSARVLGMEEDAGKYERLHADVVDAFRKAYVSTDGVVRGDTQTAYVLALGFDLLDEATAKKAASRLVARIEERRWHLSTGFVGTRDLMRVLTKIGRDDVAFRLLHNTDYPSWLFEVRNGATTVWERWDGYTPEKGFQDPGMNSFAHYAYGAVMGWVFSTVGGIDTQSPGFGRIVIAPRIDPRLTYATTTFESVRGPVRTAWRKQGGKLILSVEVPPNATAEIRVPNGGVKTVGSGSYRFVTVRRQEKG